MLEVNEAMSKLVSIYRHDFLNVLQVVGGLAQLNKTDRLLTYIRKASEEVQQLGRLIGCGDPRLAFLLYEGLLQECTCNFVVHTNGDIPLLDEHLLESLDAFLRTTGAQLQGLGECTLSLTIHGQKMQLLLQVHNDGATETLWSTLQHAAAQGGLAVAFDEKRNELSIGLDKVDSEGEK